MSDCISIENIIIPWPSRQENLNFHPYTWP